MLKQLFNLNTNIKLFYFTLYILLILGFIFNEDSSGGAEWDFNKLSIVIEGFSQNLILTLNNYYELKVAHYPFYYVFLSWLLNIFGNLTKVKLVILHLSILLPLLFYLKLKLIYKNKFLILLPGLFFLSPYYRSSAIWGLSDNIALIMFSLSIYFYLKILGNLKKNYFKNNHTQIFLCVFFLACCCYIRQYYAVFAIFFTIKFFIKLKKSEFLIFLLVNIILSIPAFYLSFFNKNFSYSYNFFETELNLIIFNIFICLNIFSFYLVPLYFDKKNFLSIINFYLNQKLILFIILLFSFLINHYLGYNNNWGGGIFYKFFKIVDKLEFLFISFFISLCIILHFIKNHLFHNLLLLIPIILFSIIDAIFQKYFDPLSLIMIFILMKSHILKNYLKNLKFNIRVIYIYFTFFLINSIAYYN